MVGRVATIWENRPACMLTYTLLPPPLRLRDPASHPPAPLDLSVKLVLFVLRLLSLWQPHHIITGTRGFNWICQILIDVNDPQNAQNINKQIFIKGENKAVLTGSRGVGAVVAV